MIHYVSAMNRFVWLIACAIALSGCGGGFNTTERPKGQVELRQPDATKVEKMVLDPVTSSASKEGIDITLRYAPPEELDKFFEKEEIFGKLAGKNPYPPATLVFYVKIANHSGKKLKVNPDDFVMIDNLNIQYSELSPDNISAIYESKANMWAFAKTTGDLAPGPYGLPLKVAGAMGGGGPRKLHYMIKQVRLAAGYVHPGITYDGYVCFPQPHPNAESIHLVIGNLKTDFAPDDRPQKAVDFEFPINVHVVVHTDSSDSDHKSDKK